MTGRSRTDDGGSIAVRVHTRVRAVARRDGQELLSRTIGHGAFVARPEGACRQDLGVEHDSAIWGSTEYQALGVDRVPATARGVGHEAAVADELGHTARRWNEDDFQ